jgi:uncharacterized glyoxalase superfamily protein PhnB
MSAGQSVSSQVEVAVSAEVAFRAFTEEMDLWWVRGPINFYDAARAVAKVCEPGVGGRILEVYDSGDPLEVARITGWEPGALVAWQSSVDDVRTEVRFSPLPGGGTLVRVTAMIPDGGADRGGTAFVRVVPPWFGAWCARRDGAPRTVTELARLAVAVYYPKPASAARWLADAFGLTPTNPLPTDETARAWIEFHVGNCSLLVFGLDSEGGADGAGGASGATHVPWLFVDDLDAHFARAVAHGAVIVEGIRQHGYRAYVARDPDGYTWTIAQARPGMR